MVTDEDPKK